MKNEKDIDLKGFRIERYGKETLATHLEDETIVYAFTSNGANI